LGEGGGASARWWVGFCCRKATAMAVMEAPVV
jgi:hypothetical protein